ncbi:RHS repeat domain-containing protein [Luteimonas sp. 22616]|uniref:RHS repeat domain-containing protein n=1 Tax=Luteimonas sp. 22616 TaxID=3453951 RepID=UPI003F87B844
MKMIEIQALGQLVPRVFLLGLILGCASVAQAQTVEYIHTDALGSPVAVTNSAGQVIERTEYAPYGEQLNRPNDNKPGYTGHVADVTTGLSYMQQRYYDPQIGRFLSRDPVTANPNTGANFNAYWYANNNPYKFSDPDGRQAKSSSCGDTIYCGPDPQYRDLPNGERPSGPFEPSKTRGEVNQNGMVQRNENVKSQIETLRSAMDLNGHKAAPLIVTGGESHVANDGRVRSVTDGSVISNRKSNSAHNVENGSRAIDLRAITISHKEFMSIVRAYTEFTNNTNDYRDRHEHLGLPNRSEFSCSPGTCIEP